MRPTVDDPVDYRQVLPRDPLEMWLVQRWREVLGFPVGIRDNFFGVGGNSLDAARVVNAVWEKFEIQLPLNVLTINPEIEKLAAELRGLRARLLDPLVEIQYGEETHPPLFLVHPVSGQVGPYCGLSHAIGDEFAVFGLQAVGLYSDEEPLETIPAMASRYVEALRSVRPAGPYCLGGCSTGSMIAFEMARQLVDAGSQVRLLAVIDPAHWTAHEVVAENETTDFARRARRVRHANDMAARGYSPDPYPGTIDVFRAAGSQWSEWDWSAVAPCRVHICATGDEALGRQLRSRITAGLHP
ncbi:MAG TPA: thioesterase domain-containing protein [Pseudonocardiaceae bacterium]|nr:thioesterase domain-containing protein [Pseudonocardiaceae bacterium]